MQPEALHNAHLSFMRQSPHQFSENRYYTAAHNGSDQDCSWAAAANTAESQTLAMSMGVECVFCMYLGTYQLLYLGVGMYAYYLVNVKLT